MISGVILARNEQENIVDCINAMQPHVSEVVLIDMESSDATIELAQPLVSQVLHHPLVDGFDAARNIAIDRVRNQWLWFVDADERLNPEIGAFVNQLVLREGADFEALYVPFKSYFCGQWIQHSGWWPGYTMPRVLKRGHFRFRDQLHGGVEVDGRTRFVPAEPHLGVDHFSYRDLSHYVDKFNPYTSREATILADKGAEYSWEQALRDMVRDLHTYYESNRGKDDGALGWVLAWQAGQYRWMANSKLLDQAGANRANGDAPNGVSHAIGVMRSELSRQKVRTGETDWDNVVLRTPLWDYSGYADDGRQVAKALAHTSRQVRCEALHWNDAIVDIDVGERALLKALSGVERRPAPVCITNGIPGMFGPDPDAAINILRTTFESDRIPWNWLGHLAQFDEIWVFSEQSAAAFVRGGASASQLRIVPSAIDTSVFRTTGKKTKLPSEMEGRFVFFSTFDWQLRKGWDVLLKSYCEAFDANQGVGLLIKVTSLHGQPWELILEQAENCLALFGQSLGKRPDIHLYQQDVTQTEMAGLYRAVDAFVLPTRGEGWGRPIMEAMACGAPTIIPGMSGQSAFVTSENACLIDSAPADVSEAASSELPVYEGHRWWEPSIESCRDGMKRLFEDRNFGKAIAKRASKDIRERFSTDALSKHLEDAINSIADGRVPVKQMASPDAVKVRLEGEFFSGHSFANINEVMAMRFAEDEQFMLVVSQRETPNESIAPDKAGTIAACRMNDSQATDVVIRHAFPPDWSPPESGYWVHIQPWEFGHLPLDWIQPLHFMVDEVWAPTEYVRDVYIASGIDEAKIHVVPWGIDANLYKPDVTPLAIPGRRPFAFLFVGGTIERKGFDRVFQAFCEEFSQDDDVCLVVKDLGANTFYRYGNYRDRILSHIHEGAGPQMVYMDHDMSDAQRASLYAACDCLVMPYRGEGFGLPILESMACGTASIVPKGGASDDFTNESVAYYVDATMRESDHDWRLTGPATELQVEVSELRKVMRAAFSNRDQTASMGEAAARFAHERFCWDAALDVMSKRIIELAKSGKPLARHVQTAPLSARLSAVAAITGDDVSADVDTLASAAAASNELIVLVDKTNNESVEIANEYTSRVYGGDVTSSAKSAIHNSLLKKATGAYNLILSSGEVVHPDSIPLIRERLPNWCSQGGAYWCDVIDGKSDRILTREVRIIENKNDLVFPFLSGCDIAPSIDLTKLRPADVKIEVWHPSTWLQSRRPGRIHADIEQFGPHWSLIWRMGVEHLLSGNPFHAECYLADALSATPETHPMLDLLYSQLALANELTGNPYAQAGVVESAKERLGNSNPLPNVSSFATQSLQTEDLRLYLGAGNKSLPGYVGVDIKSGPTIGVCANLNETPWPWDAQSVDQIVAEDVVEHLALNPIEFCDEAWRVLKPGGELFVRTPHHSGDSSWIDPTHRWHLNEQSFDYLDPATHWGQIHPHYTDRKWRILSRGVRGPQNIHIVMTPRA